MSGAVTAVKRKYRYHDHFKHYNTVFEEFPYIYHKSDKYDNI